MAQITPSQQIIIKLLWQKSLLYRIVSVSSIALILFIAVIAPEMQVFSSLQGLIVLFIGLLFVFNYVIYFSVKRKISQSDIQEETERWMNNHPHYVKAQSDARPIYKYIAIGFVIFFVIASLFAILGN